MDITQDLLVKLCQRLGQFETERVEVYVQIDNWEGEKVVEGEKVNRVGWGCYAEISS